MFTREADLFCKVIDNYADAGFSLRLARDLCLRGMHLRLFCDHPEIVKKIASASDLASQKLKILPWPEAQTYHPAGTVLEAFSCRLNEELLQKIRQAQPLLIAVDYLCAEKFVEECHGLPTYADGLKGYFFFPGFTSRTGGLIVEDEFKQLCLNHQEATDDGCRPLQISLFCYQNSKLENLLNFLKKSSRSCEVTAFLGQTSTELGRIYQKNLAENEVISDHNLRIRISRMLSQPDYDHLLLNSDLNLVRGEDSFVRAQLCGKPFLWQIYVQDEEYHKVKLEAFFRTMQQILPSEDISTFEALDLAYCGFGNFLDKLNPDEFLTDWRRITAGWAAYLHSLKPLGEALIDFIIAKS